MFARGGYVRVWPIITCLVEVEVSGRWWLAEPDNSLPPILRLGWTAKGR
jgi:hypothetical protein